MGLSGQIGTIQPSMIADMDIINGNPLKDIETIANDVYVIQNGNVFTEHEILKPYANVHLNTPPTSSATAAVARAEAGTLASGNVNWATPFELGKLQRAVILLCHTD